jgi:hypothetical protein
MAAINDIPICTALAAVREDAHLRVYETDVDGGIREVQYEGRWMGGQQNNAIAKGKVGTPIAATSIGLQHIRVYYVTQNNCLGEAAYDSGSGWYDGNLTAQQFNVAPESSVAAVLLGGQTTLRVYGQLPDNTIQEWVCKLQPIRLPQAIPDLTFLDTGEHGWTLGSNLGHALPGTQIAATTWGNNPVHIRYAYLLFSHTYTNTQRSVYAQDTSLNVFEKTWDGQGWHTGGLRFSNPIPRAALAVTSWGGDDGLGIRLYYGAPGNVVREKAWDGGGGWYDGGFEQACIPASNIAAIPLGILRVYLQTGTEDTAVTEYMWSNGWQVGYRALPPA